MTEQQPESIAVSKLFTGIKYKIPIYQRNYAWEEKQIHQLIDDINASDRPYYLGNLIVNRKEADVFEVIDGQQRLTTLYLLEKYLNMDALNGSLFFEAREKSNYTLKITGSKEAGKVLEELQSKEINLGYRIIDDCFNQNKIDREDFKRKLGKVHLIRIQVPRDIDLNHYFEIMNTRGEQLELHEIAKAKFTGILSTDRDKHAAALIWEACSNMNSYIQMNFSPDIRRAVFSGKWSELLVKNFDEFKEKLPLNESRNDSTQKTLVDLLKNPGNNGNAWDSKNKPEDNERFESIISFPNFILQVNKAVLNSGEDESNLDDKNLLKNIESNWSTPEKSKEFLFSLLKCRFLFDRYILKREFASDYKEAGKWSLQRLECYDGTPGYSGTFGEDDNKTNRQIRTLQSCLRITYTSPRTMHWVSLTLTALMNDENCNILEILEKYCRDKVTESGFEKEKGFGIARIVFSYLDYILYRDGYSCQGEPIIKAKADDWQFQFRNSIEHFHPQNQIGEDSTGGWDDSVLNELGNLALITVSGNSKFSNLPPEVKVNSFPGIVKQSLKLKIMEKMITINKGKWDENISTIHKEEMFKLLRKEIQPEQSPGLLKTAAEAAGLV